MNTARHRRTRSCRPIAIIVALTGSLLVTGAGPASAQGGPTFEASLSGHYAAGCGFAAGASLTVTVHQAPGGEELSGETVAADEGGCFNAGFGFELTPGMLVSVHDGASLKQLELVTLSIDAIDPGADTATGTAPPNATFNVDAFVEQGWVSAFPVVTDAVGAWTAAFGPLDADINPFTHVGANIPDDDGDQTIFDTRLQPGSEHAVTDPSEFQAAIGDHTVIDFEDVDASPLNNTWVGRAPLDGARYAASGVTFSNPNGYPLFVAPRGLFWNESNSLSVRQFPFDDNADDGNDDDLVVDLDPPRVAVGFTLVDNGSPDEFAQFLDADGEIIDQVDFPGNHTEFRAFLGVVSPDRPVARIRIVELADDSDDVDYDDFILVDSLPVPPPSLTVTLGHSFFGCCAEVFGSDASVRVEGFTPDSTVTLELLDSPGGAVLASETATTDQDGFLGRSAADLFGGAAVTPGMHVVATDDVTGIVKEVTVVDATFDVLDTEADTGVGTAPPGTHLVVYGNLPDGSDICCLEAVADDGGDWSVDFGGEGIDIVPHTQVTASVGDDDGDESEVATFPRLIVGRLTTDLIRGAPFLPSSIVHVEVLDGPGGTVLFEAPVAVDASGELTVGPATHGLDLVPGMQVVAADRELTLAPLTIELDPVADAASGTGPPDATLGVGFQGEEFAFGTPGVVADASGNWSVELEDDVEPGWTGYVLIDDPDGDTTLAEDPVTSTSAVGSLQGAVDGLVAQGALSEQHSASLTATLRQVLQSLERGHTNAAISQLRAFVSRVNALVRSKKLSAADAEPLLDAAEEVIASLGG